MQKSTWMFDSALFFASIMIGRAFIIGAENRTLLLTFFALGTGLGVFRLFVNSNIKKMKGKGWGRKIVFFGSLLAVGLPVQNWFRKNVLLAIEPSYLLSSIIMLIVGIICSTALSSYLSTKKVAEESMAS